MLRWVITICLLWMGMITHAQADDAAKTQSAQDKARIVKALLGGDNARGFAKDPMLPPTQGQQDTNSEQTPENTTPMVTSADVASGEKRGLFEVKLRDAEKTIGEALAGEGAAEYVGATLLKPRNAVLYRASTPITVEVATLNYNSKQHTWSANLLMTYEGNVVSAMPASGKWQEMQKIPVLSRSMRQTDVITESDILEEIYPAHRLPANTITSREALLGKTPKRIISPNRPIRVNEVQAQMLVAKDTTVTMRFASAGMEITAVGITMEAGAQDQLIRVRNADSNTIVQATVISATEVRVGDAPSANITAAQPPSATPTRPKPIPLSASFPPPPPPTSEEAAIAAPAPVVTQEPLPAQNQPAPTTTPTPAATVPTQKGFGKPSTRLKMTQPSTSSLSITPQQDTNNASSEAAKLLTHMPSFGSNTSSAENADSEEGIAP